MAIKKGPNCFKCQQPTTLGELTYPRAYWWCKECKTERFPESIEERAEHSLTPCNECRGMISHDYFCTTQVAERVKESKKGKKRR